MDITPVTSKAVLGDVPELILTLSFVTSTYKVSVSTANGPGTVTVSVSALPRVVFH